MFSGVKYIPPANESFMIDILFQFSYYWSIRLKPAMNISSSDHILFHLHVVSTSLMRENVTNYFFFVLFLAYKVALAHVTCVTVQPTDY